MAILFSGELNADKNGEIHSLTRKRLKKLFDFDSYTADDDKNIFESIRYHIILGDASFMIPGNERKDSATKFALLRRNFPTLIVMGNKEPIYGKLDKIQEVDKGLGEKVYLLPEDKPGQYEESRQYIAYLKRGKIYNIDGLKCLVLGGALTPEKDRIPKLWHADEYWSKQEKENLLNLLEKENNFDIVLSHTGPSSVNDALFAQELSFKEKSKDEVAELNEKILNKITFKEWWCSHWHQDINCLNEKTKVNYRYLHKRFIILENYDGKLGLCYSVNVAVENCFI